MMIDLIDNGPLVYPTVTAEDGQTRAKKYSKLNAEEQLQDVCDVQATNIFLHGLPPDVYSPVTHQEATKDIFDRIKLLMKGTEGSYTDPLNKLRLAQELERFGAEILQIDEVNSSVNSHGNRDNREHSSDGKKVDDKCNRSIKEGGEERNDRDGFIEDLNGDLNGEQFPTINKMAGNKNVGRKDNMEYLDKEGNYGGTGNINNDVGVKTVVIGDESDNNSKDEVNVDTEKSKVSIKKVTIDTCIDRKSGNNGVNLVDTVKASKLDNKLISVPTQTSETGNGMVILDDEIFELGNEEGIKEVIKNGLWMVNNKPMVVQKWNIDICFDKAEPKKMPIWVKLLNVPMEAWSVKGINALASSLGKPIIMDEVTTKMYVTGVGRISFARALVEIDARKGIKDKIKIMYQSKNVSEGTKKVVQYGRMWREGRYGNENNRNSKFKYRVRDDEIRKKSMNNNNGKYIEANGRNTTNEQASGGNIERKENSMNNVNEDELIPSIKKIRIVNEFLSKQGNVNNKEMNGWNEDMKRYCKDKKELLDAARTMEKNEDVMGMNDGEGNDVLRNEVEGRGIDIAKIPRKELKTGQERTREWKEYTRAGNCQEKSTKVNIGQPGQLTK
nr:RNA-directed DNA polymerase, eukaryota, reverse transcriptase zinc-binding domain protein [Tanacetum cinerariifolium]